MRIAIDLFRGEVPRLTRRALPDNAAQSAVNARLLSGDLEAWRQFSLVKSLATPDPVRTIFLLDDEWLSWSEQVDVARGVIPGDDTYRTYITCPDLYAQPRFTNYDLATTGAEPYPVETRPLGVPSPTEAPVATPGVSADPAINVSDAGNQLATSWTTSGTTIIGAVVSDVSQDASKGNAAPSYKLRCANNVASPAFAYRDFGVEDSAVIKMTCEFAPVSNGSVLEASWKVGCTEAGAGPVVKFGYPNGASGGPFLGIGSASSWGAVGSWLELISTSPLDGSGATWYRVEITCTRNADGTTKVDATIFNGASQLVTASVQTAFPFGGHCGVEMVTSFPLPEFHTHYDNITVTGDGSVATISNTATAYLYTFVNDLGEESAPSPVSSTVLRTDGVEVTVEMPAGLPTGISSDYEIATKRLYRVATGATGSIYRFVAEVDISDTTYVDALTDAELGEALESEDWDLPPDDLEGIMALPNGIMVGFRRNQLCFSAQNRPHAWPVAYRLNTDSDIVAIGNVDTTVVVVTKTFVYTASGTSPDSYSMSAPGVEQACVSKRSISNLAGGVVFASPDGLMLAAGPTSVRNLTAQIFTRQQWQALAPETILGVVHDDVYFLFFEPVVGNPAGYAIDAKGDGFGVIELGFHATAAHTDPLTDALHLVLDVVDEPSAPYLPLISSAPDPDGSTIYQFDADDAEAMAYSWRGKLNLLPFPVAFHLCQVRADDFDNLVLRLYAEGDMLLELRVTSDEPFTLPMDDAYKTVELEMVGTSRVRTVQLVEDVRELT